MPVPFCVDADITAVAESLQVPEGYRVEIIEGNLVVSPTPVGPHIKIASRLHYAIRALLSDDHEVVQTLTVVIPVTGERYVPDLVVLADAVLDESVWKFPSTETALVVEITSPSNANTDRVVKPRGYARGEVPAYLLIDTESRLLTLFEEPENGVYLRQVQVAFGAKLDLPAPFQGPLDTSLLG